MTDKYNEGSDEDDIRLPLKLIESNLDGFPDKSTINSFDKKGGKSKNQDYEEEKLNTHLPV